MQTINEKMPLLDRFSQLVVSPELARILLALATLEALMAPFVGIRWAAYAAATALCSIGVTSQLSSIALSWIWNNLGALCGQVGKLHDEERTSPPKVVQ
jgi:hypothetical protein